MPEKQMKLGNRLGVVAVSKSTSADVPSNTGHPSDIGKHGFTSANYADIGTLRARLIAIGYTAASLDKMNENDMIYAVRLADDPLTIKQ
jgi:hypothetical protein